MTGEADLALADLTITSKREKVVDFTVPYMQTGITILFSPAKGLRHRTFKTVEDLVKQDDVTFACVKGGSTERFFQNSKNPEYRQVWEKMVKFDLMTTNNNEVSMMTIWYL